MKHSSEHLGFWSLHVFTSPLTATQCHALLASQAAGWHIDYVRLKRNVVHIYCVPIRRVSPVFRGVLTQQDSCTALRGRLTFIDVENVGFVIMIAFFALFSFGFVLSVVRDLAEGGPAQLGHTLIAIASFPLLFGGVIAAFIGSTVRFTRRQRERIRQFIEIADFQYVK